MKPGRSIHELVLRLDDDMLANLRRRAAERNTTLAGFITETLQRELQRGDSYEAAHASWRARRPFALKGAPQRYPSREELNDRPLLRRH